MLPDFFRGYVLSSLTGLAKIIRAILRFVGQTPKSLAVLPEGANILIGVFGGQEFLTRASNFQFP